jgi:hypothetical protein
MEAYMAVVVANTDMSDVVEMLKLARRQNNLTSEDLREALDGMSVPEELIPAIVADAEATNVVPIRS